MGLRLRREDLIPVLVMLLAVWLAWAWTYEIWTPAGFFKPFEYWQDAMAMMGLVKSYADRGLGSLWGATNPYLGAPGVANWADFPMSEDVVFLGVGLLSRLVGVVAAMNISFLALAVLSALCLYAVARRLRVSPPVAMVAGALFGPTPYYHWRNLHHFNLTIYWFIPLTLLVWVWASGKRGLRIGERRFAWAAAICALAGVHNNYYLNYFLQVLLLVGLLHVARKKWSAALAVAALMGISMGAFLLGNADTLAHLALFGRNTEAVARGMMDTITYGLRPQELLIPGPAHQFAPFAKLGALYRSSAPLTGEFPSTFLGVLGGLAFVGMLVSGLRGFLFGEGRGAGTRFSLFSIWLMFTAIAGGLMQLAQTILGFVAFRSNNRASIFLLALALLFLARWLSKALRGKKPVLVGAVCGVLLAFGLWEEAVDRYKVVYAGGWKSFRAQFEKKAASDEKFAKQLEASLPQGSALFQLPPMAFPEGGGAPGVTDYDLFRPYLYTKHLRYSYGAMKGRPEVSFQFEVARLAPNEQLERLLEKSFKGVIFHLGHYPRSTVEAFAQAASARVKAQVHYSDQGDLAAVLW